MLFGRKKPETAPVVNHVGADISSVGRVTYPKLQVGALLDLLDSDGNFLCKALLRKFSVHELDFVRQEGMLSLPVLSPGEFCRVTGHTDNGESFMLGTKVSQSSRVNLRLRELALLAEEESRSGPRYFVDQPAELFRMGLNSDKPSGVAESCVLMDISLEGGRIRSHVVYPMDEILKMRIELYPRAGKISFRVQVVRVKELSDGWYEYGLLFEALPAAKRRYLADDFRHLADGA